jgi:hypothetical protein
MRGLLVTCLLLLGGCRSLLGLDEATFDAAARCASSETCPGPVPACLLPEGVCVQCTAAEPAACAGATPVCDEATHACIGCRAHADCLSNTCLPDGRCAAEPEVAYVRGGASGAGACTRNEPCALLSTALDLAPPRPYVRILPGTVVESSTILFQGRAVTIVGEPGAVLRRSSGGTLLQIEEAATRVVIQDVAVSNNTFTGPTLELKDGELSLVRVTLADNAGIGVRAQRGVLRLHRSLLVRNARGGVTIDSALAAFEVIGNVFVENGTPTAGSGALRANLSQATVGRLELNTFHANVTASGGAAIDCDGGTFTARSNIVSGSTMGAPERQTAGSCGHAHSIFFALPAGELPAGPGNVLADPLFANPAAGDLHLRAGSPALDAADPAIDLTGGAAVDLDGDRRTHPADIGADEAP